MATGFFDDPATLALLNMGAGFGQASGPSRMPVPLGMALGGGAAGMAQGAKQVLEARKSEAEAALGNAAAQEKILPMNLQRQVYGMSPLGDNGLPQQGGEVPQMPSDLSKVPLLARSAMKIPVSPAQWLLATNGVSLDDPRFQKAGIIQAMNEVGLKQANERNYYQEQDPDTFSLKYHPIAQGVPGTVQDPSDPTKLVAPPENTGAVRAAGQAAAGGRTAGEAENEPAPAVVTPQGGKAIPTNPDGTPKSRLQWMKENPVSYIQKGYGDGGPLDQVSPLARTIAMGYEGGMGKNPRSTAEGFGQFIDGTFLPQAQKLWPAVFGQPGTTPQVSPALTQAFKNEPVLMAKAIDSYAGQNATQLTKAGLDATPENLLLAHRFGPGGAKPGAIQLLQADPKASAGSILGPDVLLKNPDLQKKTVGDVLADAQKAAAPLTAKIPQAQTQAAQAQAPTPTPAAPAPASGPLPLDNAIQKEAALYKIPANSTEAPKDLADAQKKAREGGAELEKEANAAQAIRNTTRSIFSVLNNPKYDPKGAAPALQPVASALVALGLPKDQVYEKILNVGTSQELSKNYMQLVGPMVKSLGERATRAVELWQEGFPSQHLQKEAQVLMTNVIDQWAHRSGDEQKAYRDWMTHPQNVARTADTFDTWFNENYPGEGYTAKAYANAQKQFGADFKPGSAQHEALVPSLADDEGSKTFWDLLPKGTVVRVPGKANPVRKP